MLGSFAPERSRKRLGFQPSLVLEEKAYPLSWPTGTIFMHAEVVEQLMLPEKLRLGLQQSLLFLYCKVELLWVSVSPLGQQGLYIDVFSRP